MKLDATLETRTKKDNSGTYEVVVIKITDKSEKLVFLSPAEIELIKLYNSKNAKNDLPFGK